MADTDSRSSGLPWSRESGERLRLGAALALVLMLAIPFTVFISTATLPERERAEAEKIPPQLAKLIKQPTLPEPVTPPVRPPEPELETAEVPEPEPESDQQPAPEISAVEPEPAEPSAQTIEQARNVAARSGLLAMQHQLAAMREPDGPVSTTVANVSDTGAGVGRALNPKDVLEGSGGVDDTAGPVGALETRLANRVRLFNFGEADVDTRTVRFPIDFLPS